MISFLALTSALTLIAFGFVAWPLLRNHRALQDQRRSINKSIYEQRLLEIAAEQASGRLNEAQAQSQRDEAGRTLLSDLDTPALAIQTSQRKQHWLACLAVFFLLPGIAIAVYLQSDSWRLIGASDEAPAWAYVLRRMEAHLTDNPDDQQTLLNMARTQRASGDMRGALESYSRLNMASNYRVAEYLADEAETRILMAEGAFSEKARERLGQALAANPDDGRALWYSGLAALNAGDKAMALQHWQHLRKQQLPEAFRKVLDQQLTQLGAPPATTSGPRIQLRISAAHGLLEGLSPATPVFVMARPAEGTRHMLAVRKHRLDELPVATVLTDGMNMAGGPQLSAYDEWRVIVRIATSGDALPKSGDPYAEAVLEPADINKPVAIVIDQRWP